MQRGSFTPSHEGYCDLHLIILMFFLILVTPDSVLDTAPKDSTYNDPHDSHEITKKYKTPLVLFSWKEMLTGLLKGKREVIKSKNFH